MVDKYLLVCFLAIFPVFTNVSCSGLPGNGTGQNEMTEGGGCAKLEKDQCKDNKGCVYVVDTCREQYKLIGLLPSDLGKVKKIAVSTSTCAIDENDQLWCFSKLGSNLEVYPHPSLIYNDVSLFEKGMCAIDKAGAAKCYNENKNVDAVRASKPFTNAIYNDQAEASCAIDVDGELHCESDRGLFDDLPVYIKKLGLVAKPKMLFPKTSNAIHILFDNGELISIGSNRNDPSGWTSILKANNVAQHSYSPNSECIVKSNGMLLCKGHAYGASGSLQIPDNLKNETFLQVATHQDHTCAIKRVDNELVCFGSKKLIRSIPKEIKGVKQVEVGPFHTCIINKDDMLQCFDMVQ